MPLGPDPVELDDRRLNPDAFMMSFDPPFALYKSRSARDRIEGVAESHGRPPSEEAGAWARALLPSLDGPDAFGLCALLADYGDERLATELLAELRGSRPGDPWLELMAMNLAANARRWSEVHRRGAGIVMSSLPGDLQAFVCLMSSIASLYEDKLDEAARFARAARDTGQMDSARALIDSVDEMRGMDDLDGRLQRDPVWIRYLRGVVRFDDLVARGRDDEALEHLDLPWAFMFQELQGLARLATLRMDLPCETPAERYRLRATLIALLVQHKKQMESGPQSLPMGSKTWSPERIAAVVARARALLGVTS